MLKSSLLMLAVGAIFLASVSGDAWAGEPATVAPTAADKLNFVALGDSHTENGVYAKETFRILSAAGKATAKYQCFGYGGRRRRRCSGC